MKDLMSVICLNFMHHGEGALCYLAQTSFCLWGVTAVGEGGHSKQFHVFGGSGSKRLK